MGNNVPSDAPLFWSDTGVTLLGGGHLGPGDLAAALALAPRLVAADGGAAAALDEGRIPEAVYGDMDSLAQEARARLSPGTVHAILEQDSTDFDKALRHIRAPVVLAAGFTGDRVDHELAVYHGLVARPEARCIVIGARDLVLHAPPELVLDLPEGTRLSLFPMARVTGRDSGLEWPIANVVFDPARRIGTSNRIKRAPLQLVFDTPGMLVIVPRDHLGAVTAAVAAASVWSRTKDAGWV
ncbi:thiamine diphosphokinase [Roseicyclus mahoneyensis]|uniref:Thiamine diphosphokinase n=1 Tax=Roseicyclus mahoneyensis TaxID=164332 RepID=A0A316GIW8_9RHOB|nr:thiamine diphosphokinase [Roseicyclus mahoneyensis]PWK60720.1 thiamine pyrophosphokinase [Roseicyclus mahoneyensis]